MNGCAQLLVQISSLDVELQCIIASELEEPWPGVREAKTRD